MIVALVLLAILLVIGVPVAFAIGLGATGGLLGSLPALPAVTTVAQRVATGLDSFALLAIPLFILAGQILHRGGAARRLVDLGRALVGSVPGGLVLVDVIACLLFGSLSGSAVAAAAAIGGFMVPEMEREGYGKGYSAAVNLTASTTGLLIPPSNVLIVYSLASGASVAALFVAGYLPGLLLGLAIATTAALLALGRSYPRGEPTSFARVGRALVGAFPSLSLILIVMGGIVAGVFTATEAAGIAVVWALILTVFVYRELELSALRSVLLESATTTGIVLMLVATSMALSWMLAFERIPQRLTEALLGSGSGEVALLLLINVCLLLVGTLLDITPAILIFTPILLPVVEAMGMHPVHFGLVLVLNLCIGLCTPPVGTVLFVGCGVARARLGEVVPSLVPLYLAMVAALVVVTFWPALSLVLPRWLGLLS